jgi:choline dehydrogenase
VLIQPNYLQCAADAEVLARGIELTRELTHARGLCDFADDAQVPFGISGATFARLSLPAGRGRALSEFIAATSTTVWHPAGTCGMGRGRDAVVDPQLRLHGIEGLRVADASVIPTVPAGNINAACIMIGERCAELVGA